MVASNVLTVNITELPVAAFTVADTTCLGNATAFTDQSTTTLGTIVTWLWNFGDNQTSTLQNPTNTYATYGDFTATLTVTNTNGCQSTATKRIHISTIPTAAFTYSSPDCVTRDVTFTDKTTIADGALKTRLWDYGDGSPAETRPDNLPFTHTFTSAGSYNVTLTVSNNFGCAKSITRQIAINPLPQVDFGVPKICLTDGTAMFTDSTTIADKSNSSFTYAWNFGDPGHSSNTSALKNPSHIYSATGNYIITLKVTSNNNCDVTKTKILTVNGTTPAAIFTPDNAVVCSNQAAVFTNASTVDFGNVTRLEIYYDHDNNPLPVIDSNPYPGKKYNYKYPEFNNPASKVYNIWVLAYSGASCRSAVYKTSVTLTATPLVKFDAIPPTCLNDGVVQILTTKTSGRDGGGVYSGTGVNTNGLFDPLVTGVGTFPIKYIYTSANGCADTVSQNITVNPSPAVSGGRALAVLEGGDVTIHATASDNVTYSWSPSTYLNSTTVLNPVVKPVSPITTDRITYTLTVTNASGCTAKSTVSITILKAPVVPNTFTPNGDNHNDTWNIKYLDSYPGCTIDVFTRNGGKVFSSIGYGIPWDGRFRGTDLPTGVYYYVINPKNGRSTLSGSVTIIR